MFWFVSVAFLASTLGHIFYSRRLIRELNEDKVRLRRLQHETFKCYVDELDKNYDLQRRLSLASK